MGYQDKKKDYGNKWLNDPGDDPGWTEEEEFESLADSDMKPEDFADKPTGERFRKWKEENWCVEQLSIFADMQRDGIKAEDLSDQSEAERYTRWLQKNGGK